MTKSNLYIQNKSLFFVSLLSVFLMLLGLFYGFNVTQMLSTQKENEKLKKEIKILKTKLYETNRHNFRVGNNNI